MPRKQKINTFKQSRKDRKRQLRRESIIEMAEQSFINNGYHNTKLDDIAFNAGYTKATVYNYFESKEDLFAALLSKTYEQMFNSLHAFLESSGSFDDIRTLGNAYLSFVNEYPDQADLLDSGVCVTINQKIIEKENLSQELTESEQSFKANELKVAGLMIDVIVQFTKKTGVELTVSPSSFIKALSAVNFMIREVIRRGKVTKQSNTEINDILSIIFTIIEQGVKNYDTK
jgi:AcrR family transcriptional regulator